MMTSEARITHSGQDAFVWIWLPGATVPVVAGKVYRTQSGADDYRFLYGQRYLANPDAISLYDPDLPLRAGEQVPPGQHNLAPCLRDALPDAWGRRVIISDLTSLKRAGLETTEADELTFMLRSGSDRIGALDFQTSAREYVARGEEYASLEDLQRLADMVQSGEPISPVLDRAVLHGSSIGGARPKALLTDGDRRLIAKFSASNDPFGMVKAEFATMRLAAKAGLTVAHVDIEHVLDRDALIIERFDRLPAGQGQTARRAMVSALTWTGEQEMTSRHVSYVELAEIIRTRFYDAAADLRELFRRLTFNILVGNTDDHCRNHAAFWNGRDLRLTPAYDIAPQIRGAAEANQALLITDSHRESRLVHALEAAPAFRIASEQEARRMIDDQIGVIRANWSSVCDDAGMTQVEREFFMGRQILNPYAFEGYAAYPGFL
ncbi:type II toxin-antitoxin system HipA family toxin [Gluconacetobacter sp. Hr-1-5]|uniref:type II toxin-antitoxin system HipA family toxin n=1 Tax=Gluconacetobacter sp. Hr-1-5 TaxID=3395370 RepID=UPI003B51CBE8